MIYHRIIEKYRERLNTALGRSDWVFTEHGYGDGHYRLKIPTNTPHSNNEIARFSLLKMPGCCGILISTDSCVYDRWRRRGIGKILNELRRDQAREEGYGVLLCTDVTTNTAQRKILETNGWEDIYEFDNPRTSNRVAISVINL